MRQTIEYTNQYNVLHDFVCSVKSLKRSTIRLRDSMIIVWTFQAPGHVLIGIHRSPPPCHDCECIHSQYSSKKKIVVCLHELFGVYCEHERSAATAADLGSLKVMVPSISWRVIHSLLGWSSVGKSSRGVSTWSMRPTATRHTSGSVRCFRPITSPRKHTHTCTHKNTHTHMKVGLHCITAADCCC